MTVEQSEAVDSLLDEVAVERVRQLEMWGQQDHPVTFNSNAWVEENDYWHDKNDQRVEQGTLTWDGILMEEVAEALMETDLHRQRKEFIEVAAVAIAAAEAVDRRILQQEREHREMLVDWEKALLEHPDTIVRCGQCVTVSDDREEPVVDYETGRKASPDVGRHEVSVEINPDGTIWASGPTRNLIDLFASFREGK